MSNILASFIGRVQREELNVFSIVLTNGDGPFAEHHFAPDEPRCVYSVAKSYLSTAVGMAIDDGLLGLEELVTDTLCDHLPDDLDPNYNKITLRHLLTMSSGHKNAILMEKERWALRAQDWAKHVFEQPLPLEPGTRFVYSNGSCYLASLMVEKATGKTLRDYLFERLFEPMGIAYPEWEHCPLGHTFAPSRLVLTTEEMSRLGVLYLQGGIYNGKRLLSLPWVQEATRKQIDSCALLENFPCKDDCYGYGYQFWMTQIPGVYRAFGRIGQNVIVIPDKNVVIATQAEQLNSQPILDAIWEEVYPRL